MWKDFGALAAQFEGKFERATDKLSRLEERIEKLQEERDTLLEKNWPHWIDEIVTPLAKALLTRLPQYNYWIESGLEATIIRFYRGLDADVVLSLSLTGCFSESGYFGLYVVEPDGQHTPVPKDATVQWFAEKVK